MDPRATHTTTLASMLESDRKHSREIKKKKIFFALLPNITYSVLIHDPSFYLFAYEPFPTPLLLFTLDQDRFYQGLITVKKHRKMSQKLRPCNAESNYSFNQCIRDFIAEDIGCYMPWETQNNPKTNVCSDVESIKKYQTITFNIASESTYESLVERTGCIAPCDYMEYNLAAPLRSYSGVDRILEIYFVDDKVSLEEEILSYNLVSLISDIGGSLGLFLGFSFLTSLTSS